HGNFCAVGYHNPKREKVSGPMGSNPACYELGVMQPTGLDWPQASAVMAQPSSLTPAEQEQAQSAVIATWSRLDCCCMLTALIRMDRFCDNLLYDAVRSGLVAMILQRFSQLLVV
ncbi:DUF6508 domain-containing protein, partial [Aeromonas veronii]